MSAGASEIQPSATLTESELQVRREFQDFLKQSEFEPLKFSAVDVGDEITLSQAYEPVVGGNFPAQGHLRTGTVQAIQPTVPLDGRLALVYMTENQRGWWLKVPTEQDVEIHSSPLEIPEPPYSAETVFLPQPPVEVVALRSVPAGTVVDGLRIYSLDAMAGLAGAKSRTLNNALVMDHHRFDVNVDNKAMLLMRVHDGVKESICLAEAESAVERKFAVPDRVSSVGAELTPVPSDLHDAAYGAPFLVQGISDRGVPVSYYGTVLAIEPFEDGLRVSPSRGVVSEPETQWLTCAREGALWQVRAANPWTARPDAIVPAKYLVPGQVLENGRGDRATVSEVKTLHDGSVDIEVHVRETRGKIHAERDKSFIVKPDADPAFDQGAEERFENAARDVDYSMDTSWLQELSTDGPSL